MDLWTNASRDVQSEAQLRTMASIRVHGSRIWPFLALARSETEFGHRMALVADRIDAAVAAVVEPDDPQYLAVKDQYIASLQHDFEIHLAAEKSKIPPEFLDHIKHKDGDGDGDKDGDSTTKESSFRKASVSLKNVSFDGPIGGTVGKGTDPSGKVVRFRLSPSDAKQLAAVLTGDLAINFSGVDVDESDIISDKEGSLQVEAVAWSRRHYEDLASSLSNFHEADKAAEHFAKHLSGTNPQYRAEQFRGAASTKGGYKVRGGTGTATYSRGHYNHIAAGIKSYPGDRAGLANHLAEHLSKSNPAFKKDLFLKASTAALRATADGVSQEKRDQAKAQGDTLPGTDKFPIENRSDLEKAKHDIGRTNEPREKVVRYINNKSEELGAPPVGGDKKESSFNVDAFKLGMRTAEASAEMARLTGKGLAIQHTGATIPQEFQDGVDAYFRRNAFRKGAPFGGYDDFDACVKANSDKDDPSAYCGKIKHETEDKKESSLRATAEEHGGYHIEEDGGKFKVVNHIGEVKSTFDSKEKALAYQRALMVNVPGAAESAERHEEEGDKAKHSSLQATAAEGHRPLHEIAREINREWSKQKGGVNFAAKPYLQAMHSLRDTHDRYGADDAHGIVSYFLSNASQYRGDAAKAHKAELKAHLKDRPRLGEPTTSSLQAEAMDYEPGLGCPHCNWAGYTLSDRAAHIEREHPGQNPVAMHPGDQSAVDLVYQRQRQGAYNPLSDPESAYNNPDKGPHKGTPDDLFPEGVPLHGDLTPEQEAWLKRRGSRLGFSSVSGDATGYSSAPVDTLGGAAVLGEGGSSDGDGVLAVGSQRGQQGLWPVRSTGSGSSGSSSGIPSAVRTQSPGGSEARSSGMRYAGLRESVSSSGSDRPGEHQSRRGSSFYPASRESVQARPRVDPGEHSLDRSSGWTHQSSLQDLQASTQGRAHQVHGHLDVTRPDTLHESADDGSIFCKRCGGQGMVRAGGVVRNCSACKGSGLKRQVRKNPDVADVMHDYGQGRKSGSFVRRALPAPHEPTTCIRCYQPIGPNEPIHETERGPVHAHHLASLHTTAQENPFAVGSQGWIDFQAAHDLEPYWTPQDVAATGPPFNDLFTASLRTEGVSPPRMKAPEGPAPTGKLHCNSCGHTYETRNQYKVECPNCGSGNIRRAMLQSFALIDSEGNVIDTDTDQAHLAALLPLFKGASIHPFVTGADSLQDDRPRTTAAMYPVLISECEFGDGPIDYTPGIGWIHQESHTRHCHNNDPGIVTNATPMVNTTRQASIEVEAETTPYILNQQNHEYNDAYEAGYADGRDGKPSNSGMFRDWGSAGDPVDLHARYEHGYLDGMMDRGTGRSTHHSPEEATPHQDFTRSFEHPFERKVGPPYIPPMAPDRVPVPDRVPAFVPAREREMAFARRVQANPYDPANNPYIPSGTRQTPDNVPDQAGQPMTTRPRQIPRGRSTTPPPEPSGIEDMGSSGSDDQDYTAAIREVS